MNNLQGGRIDLAAYWARIEKTSTCWIWRGAAHSREGYGTVAVTVDSPRGRATRYERAHRIAWELANGPIPPGLFILHSCDNKQCVKPTHLRPGSQQENMADRRRPPAEKPLRNTQPNLLPVIRRGSGEHHHGSKLTDADVRTIRERYTADSALTQTDLAREYGVTKTQVSFILRGKSRKGAGGPVGPIRPIRGTRVRGTTIKLNESLVADIRKRYAQGGETIFTLAAEFGVCNQLISNVLRGRIWKHVPMPEGLCVRPSYRKLTPAEVDALRQEAANNPDATHAWLAQRHGASRAAVSFILEGKNHGPNPYGYVARRSPAQR